MVVQVQSSWFPLAELNPQYFVQTRSATPTSFTKPRSAFSIIQCRFLVGLAGTKQITNQGRSLLVSRKSEHLPYRTRIQIGWPSTCASGVHRDYRTKAVLDCGGYIVSPVPQRLEMGLAAEDRSYWFVE